MYIFMNPTATVITNPMCVIELLCMLTLLWFVDFHYTYVQIVDISTD